MVSGSGAATLLQHTHISAALHCLACGLRVASAAPLTPPDGCSGVSAPQAGDSSQRRRRERRGRQSTLHCEAARD